ncbi:uncharacterized protein LOC143453356 [Clavelina lepadiformis]|uniref:Uncharacterized protein n=1 Tax=Clavelina lepadiformis TaxID=159417 RepID=A0ABP0FXD5_CLALP
MSKLTIKVVLVSLIAIANHTDGHTQKEKKERPVLCDNGQAEVIVKHKQLQIIKCRYCDSTEHYDCKHRACSKLPQDAEICSLEHSYSNWDACKKSKCLFYGRKGGLGICTENYWNAKPAMPIICEPQTPIGPTHPATICPTALADEEKQSHGVGGGTIFACIALMILVALIVYLVFIQIHIVKQYDVPQCLHYIPGFGRLKNQPLPQADL